MLVIHADKKMDSILDESHKVISDAKEIATKMKDEIVNKANEESNKNLIKAKHGR